MNAFARDAQVRVKSNPEIVGTYLCRSSNQRFHVVRFAWAAGNVSIKDGDLELVPPSPYRGPLMAGYLVVESPGGEPIEVACADEFSPHYNSRRTKILAVWQNLPGPVAGGRYGNYALVYDREAGFIAPNHWTSAGGLVEESR